MEGVAYCVFVKPFKAMWIRTHQPSLKERLKTFVTSNETKQKDLFVYR